LKRTECGWKHIQEVVGLIGFMVNMIIKVWNKEPSLVLQEKNELGPLGCRYIYRKESGVLCGL